MYDLIGDNVKKIIIILIVLTFLVSCKNNKIKTIIKTNNIEYGTDIYLYDLVEIKNGTLKSKNYLINTLNLGQQKISIKYLDNDNKLQQESILINIVDTTSPIIFAQKSYIIEINSNINLLDKIVCGDNYDRDLKCEIKGNYDSNTIGEYPIKFVATDTSGNYYEKESKLIVKDKIVKETPSTLEYNIKDLIKEHKTNNTMIGIDVSSWQGIIDWQKVKNSGVEFAIIRIGYGHNLNNEMVEDKYFSDNLKNAKSVGIKVGLYFFSYATTNKEAISQVNWIVEKLNGEEIPLGIAFDWENWSDFNSYKINYNDLNNIAKTFLDELNKNGYEGLIYGSFTYLNSIWNTPKHKTWLAHYTSKTNYEKDYYIWQLSSTGKVDGINGYVDLNILYKY